MLLTYHTRIIGDSVLRGGRSRLHRLLIKQLIDHKMAQCDPKAEKRKRLISRINDYKEMIKSMEEQLEQLNAGAKND